MTVEELAAVLKTEHRLRIVKDEKELYMGLMGNFTPYAIFEELRNEIVKKFCVVPEIRHRKWHAKDLTPPIHPEETPTYSFSDLQVMLYYTIYI